MDNAYCVHNNNTIMYHVLDKYYYIPFQAFLCPSNI